MNAPTTPPEDTDTRATRSRKAITAMWDVIEELKRRCDAVPDSDSMGKLRGKIGRLEGALREAEENDDLTTFRADAKSAEDLVRRIHENDPMTRLLRCVTRLNERISLQLPL